MPAILNLQQIINSLDALEDEDLQELRDAIDEEMDERGIEQDELEDNDEDEDELPL